MSRFLALGNIRKVAHCVASKGKTSLTKVYSTSTRPRGHLPYTLRRAHLHYKPSFSGRTSFVLSQKDTPLKFGFWNFCAISASKLISHHALVACRRLSQICCYSGSALSPLNRIACAVCLALTRSNLVTPSVIAFIVGEFAWSQRTWAEAEHLPTNGLFMNAQDGYVLSSLPFLLLEGLILVFRAIYITLLFLPCIAMAPLANSLGVKFRRTWLRVFHLTLEKGGPAFIKWGQWAATRPDLFPRDLCFELVKLQTKAPSHSFSYTKQAIETAFGRKLPEIFDNFEEEPVASGSVAQVHRAILKYRYPGQIIKPIVVAVKVRHPGVVEAIRRDFTLINFVAKILQFIPTLKWLRLDESVQQFSIFMMTQVDLAREAANLSRFIYNFRRWKDVSFPKPLYPLVHPAVLVETYEQGESVLYYVDELEGHEQVKSSLAYIGSNALLKMLLVDNFIHADMHPGNILVRYHNSSHNRLFRKKPHVIFLDVGMTAELSKRDRLNLLEFFKAVSLRDGRTVGEYTLKLSKRQTCPDPKAFIEEVDNSFKFWGSTEGNIVHPSQCIQQLLEQVRRHQVNIDGNVCTVMVTTMVLEGWQRKLDPEYDVMQTLQELLFKVDLADSLSYTIEGLMAP